MQLVYNLGVHFEVGCRFFLTNERFILCASQQSEVAQDVGVSTISNKIVYDMLCNIERFPNSLAHGCHRDRFNINTRQVFWLLVPQEEQSCLIPRLHYQLVSSRFSSCALTSPVSTSVCVYITTARTGLNQRQLVRLFHSTVAGSRAVPKHVRACR